MTCNVELVDGETCSKPVHSNGLCEVHSGANPLTWISVSECPKCQTDIEDMDGFGVVYHEKCGYCSHVAITGDGEGNYICDFCGEKR